MIVVKRQDALHQVAESSEAVTYALLAANSTIHMAGPPRAAVVIKGPKLDRPKVNIGVTLEEWNIFTRRRDVFVSGSGLDPDASASQLFQCAGDELGDSLLKTDPSVVSKPTSVVMGAMKSLAVIVVATGVMRAELVRMQQERDESFRAFSQLECAAKPRHAPTSPSVPASAKWTSLTQLSGTC